MALRADQTQVSKHLAGGDTAMQVCAVYDAWEGSAEQLLLRRRFKCAPATIYRLIATAVLQSKHHIGWIALVGVEGLARVSIPRLVELQQD